MSIESINKLRDPRRTALVPQRSNGRERVSGILEAAAQVIQERGFDVTTMKEIADRAGANMGSLYRFFPNKAALAEALMQRYGELADAEYDRIYAMARTATTTELADVLIDFMAKMRSETAALTALLDSRSEWSARRREFRDRALGRIVKALKLRVPKLDQKVAEDMAVILHHNMKAMVLVTLDPRAATSPGAADELRKMNRLYLIDRFTGLE